MTDINLYWKAITMSWLRRLVKSNATWAKLHRADTFPYTFNPINSNYEELVKAKTMCKNSFWKDIYASLLLCRRNILTIHPEEFIRLPMNGKPLINNNNIAISQDWCKHEMLDVILNANGKF